MAAGDATLHLGWTLHAAAPNTAREPRIALAVQYFAEGARVHRELLELEEGGGGRDGGGGGGERSDVRRGIRFEASEGGPALLVRLLADDAATWTAWLRARPPQLVPGQLVNDDALTPLVHDAAEGAAGGEEGEEAEGAAFARGLAEARRVFSEKTLAREL